MATHPALMERQVMVYHYTGDAAELAPNVNGNRLHLVYNCHPNFEATLRKMTTHFPDGGSVAGSFAYLLANCSNYIQFTLMQHHQPNNAAAAKQVPVPVYIFQFDKNFSI